MFALVLQRCGYIRVRKGVCANDLKKTFSCPVTQKIFTGAIVKITPEPLNVYTVRAGESYSSIAEKAGVNAETLKELNGGAALYPTLKIFLP